MTIAQLFLLAALLVATFLLALEIRLQYQRYVIRKALKQFRELEEIFLKKKGKK